MSSVVCLWSCLVLSSMGCAVGDIDVFEECLHREVCLEDDGIDKILHCFFILGKQDQDYMLKQCAHFYGELDSPRSYLEVGCENREKAKQTIAYYYDHKMEKDRKVATFQEHHPSIEDRRKLVEARGCMMLRVEECSTKREMGLYTD